jgi:ABC-2 type transport system ATP-binding protein
MLQLHSVSKSFGAKTVLDAVSAHLSTTGVTLLSGPNGAGKTTLIRCILGLETHTGRITWDGRALKPADRRCAPVFDDTPLHPKLTGHQNLVVLGGGRPLRSSAYLDRSALQQRVSSYSFGQRKRLALMLALSSDAPLVVLDEPWNGLDDEGIAQLRDDIAGMATTRGFLVTAHTMSADDSLVDHAFVLDGAKLIDVVRNQAPVVQEETS